ncbi:MAG: class III extradiol ring-cleavage dioxygenase [Ilumatobacteraceae bacterium]|nr:class III extradiol ring-cleavage dioxygenase [Ilumatobacteraceae bacterium]
MSRLPVYAISHGGGPWPWIKDLMPVDWAPLERSLRAIPSEVGETPRAVLVVSGHWEESAFTVQTSAKPPMLYDYGGFPDFTYRIEYPAPGSPDLAERTVELLAAAGLPVARDDRRGFDHGVFAPLYVMYPDADVPVFQLSMQHGYDPAAHLAAGRALAPLRDEGVLIVGSGLPTFHDLSKFGLGSSEPSIRFDDWLTETMVEYSGAERSERLLHWASAPSARECHPREDHFVPLLVAAGAAEGDPGVRQYHEDGFMGGHTASSGYRLAA